MFNPFVLFEPRFIEAFRKARERYLVAQTYHSAADHFAEDPKDYLLFTQYEDLSKARIHLGTLGNDKYAAIIDLEKEIHRNKIIAMIAPGSNYVIYAAIVGRREDVEKRLNERYAANMRRYIAKNTSWKIGSDKTIYPKLDIAFGELFILLKYNSQQLRVTLADIHKS